MSSEKPPAGVEYQTLTVEGALTRMDAPRPPASETAAPSASLNPLEVYTPGGTQKLVTDAQNAAAAVRQHQQQLQQSIETAH